MIKKFFRAIFGARPQSTASPTLMELDRKLKTDFQDLSLLEEALTHSSFTNENPKLERPDNERLELLGDAVLDLVITKRLMQEFPDDSEGHLSKLRSAMVSERPLAEIARSFGLGEYLSLGKGETQSQGASKPSLLANTYEAILGALFLDRGFDVAEKIINMHFENLLSEAKRGNVQRDYKTLLQEWVQSRFQVTPRYVLVAERGPDHRKTFEVAIQIRDKVQGIGTGPSKKEAEQEAARVALETLQSPPVDNIA